MNESITNLPDAVAALGALPVPAGPVPQNPMTLKAARVRLTQYGERTKTWSTATYESGTERALHEIALTLLAEVDRLEAERHTTNEALDDAVQALREREQRDAAVAEFVAARAEYITAIRNCHPDNAHDYNRWQGHAAARRQLAELLSLPVAWPPEDSVSVAKSADKLTRLMAPARATQLEDPHDSPLHHRYETCRDLPPADDAT